MESIIRGVIVYLFVLLIFRVAGKRALSEVTAFDLVLTLIISESIQQALIDTDNSITNGFLVVITLVALDILFSFGKERSALFSKLVDDAPVIILRDGKPLTDLMKKERIDEGDILEAAREQDGVERLDQLKYAIVERSGQISVVRKQHRA
jgi:uncharacterized membrane protein YcaP (DUF421 family)